ncbi:hypothetical protein ABIF37_008102 [Bradyrhizobium diazoefficiens]
MLEALTRLQQLGRGAEGEARRDSVEVAALVVILRDQPLAVAIEILGRIDEFGRRVAVDPGETRDHAHVAPACLLEQLFGRDR